MRAREEIESVVIRFAGDSGDGIQLTGTQFTTESAIAGNDLVTLPNYPAEIRAPAGSLAGVSSYQIHLGNIEVNTPGDRPDVLVAMNPAALRANLADLQPGGILIVNQDSFGERNLVKAGYAADPCQDEGLRRSYQLYPIPMSTLCHEALAATGLSKAEVERCKNFFALGVMLSLFNRPVQTTLQWIDRKFKKVPEIAGANRLALEAGRKFADSTEMFEASFVIPRASHKPGTYRNITGNLSICYGLIAAAQKSGLPLFFSAYPITPASDILHELVHHREHGVIALQAEDEIAAACSAIGAAYSGALAVTATSGPGMALKTEALGLAVIAELPLLVIDVQRVGPSTGIPTKSEQADLLHALYSRPGEAPVCVMAVSSPYKSFLMTYEACRVAVKYMTPVILLSEGVLANTSEPWKLPDPSCLPKFEFPRRRDDFSDPASFSPLLRDERGARPWVLPGTPGLMHRVGGIEKDAVTGAINYDPVNHETMCRLRAEKIARIAQDIPPTEVDGPRHGKLLVVGWGSTEGTLKEAVRRCRKRQIDVSRIHLTFLNPLPADLGEIFAGFSEVLVPELNAGQLLAVLRNRFEIKGRGLNRITGQPFKVAEVEEAIVGLLSGSEEPAAEEKHG